MYWQVTHMPRWTIWLQELGVHRCATQLLWHILHARRQGKKERKKERKSRTPVEYLAAKDDVMVWQLKSQVCRTRSIRLSLSPSASKFYGIYYRRKDKEKVKGKKHTPVDHLAARDDVMVWPLKSQMCRTSSIRLSLSPSASIVSGNSPVVAHMNGLWRIYFSYRAYTSVMAYMSESHGTHGWVTGHMDESRHIWMGEWRTGSHINELWHISVSHHDSRSKHHYDQDYHAPMRVMFASWSHGTCAWVTAHMNWVMAHINESWHICTGHDTCKLSHGTHRCVMAHMN